MFLVAPLVFYDLMFVLHKQTSSSLLRIYWTPATTDFGFKQTKTESQSPRLQLHCVIITVIIVHELKQRCGSFVDFIQCSVFDIDVNTVMYHVV